MWTSARPSMEWWERGWPRYEELMGEPSWYAVQTKPRQEDQVRHRLHERAGLTVFLPKVQAVRKRRSKRVTVIEPLFPSYLFVQMPFDPDLWNIVKWTPGVKRIVAAGEVPASVPIEVVNMLQERCEDGDIIRWRQGLRAGATVHVVHGRFAGLQGILERPSSGSERVRVLLQLMGCVMPVEVDVVDIELVS